MFGLAANTYFLLLVDGIKDGRSWGYLPENIESMKIELKFRVTSKSTKTLGDEALSQQKHSLEEAIKVGPGPGIHTI